MGNQHSGTPAPLAERFWRYVERSTGCWLWIGCRQRPGYGRIGREGGKGTRYAHHVSWELHYGPIPEGQQVLHRCDNPPCVRPDHLFLGSQLENVRDMWDKGRAVPPPIRQKGWSRK
jgi:hypothetical protein